MSVSKNAEVSRNLQCDYCSTSYSRWLSLEAHMMMCELNPERIIHRADYYVYILEIDRVIPGKIFSKDIFYYVGMANDLIARLASHEHASKRREGKRISIPNDDGEVSSDVIYRIEGIYDIRRVEGNRREALNIEREVSYEIAIEKNTAKILGGR